MAKMGQKHKDFILKKLIPFILREDGRGFGMSRWCVFENPGRIITLDEAPRETPVCGTAACLGGSINILNGTRDFSDSDLAGETIGLSRGRAAGLFFHWRGSYQFRKHRWPNYYAKKFKLADTPLAKAKVAASLLKQVVKTEGKCLDRK